MILTQVERNCTICGLKYRESASLLFCVSAVSVSVCLFTFSSVSVSCSTCHIIVRSVLLSCALLMSSLSFF
jgi:hypothetical protein